MSTLDADSPSARLAEYLANHQPPIVSDAFKRLFDELARSCRTKLRTWSVKCAADCHLHPPVQFADDILQETLLACYGLMSLGKYAHRSELKLHHWFRQVMHNVALNLARRERTQSGRMDPITRMAYLRYEEINHETRVGFEAAEHRLPDRLIQLLAAQRTQLARNRLMIVWEYCLGRADSVLDAFSRAPNPKAAAADAIRRLREESGPGTTGGKG